MSFQIQSQFPSQDDSFALKQHKEKKTPAQTANDYLSILADKEQFINRIAPPDEGNISFELDGAPFSISHKPLNDTHTQVIIWGTLGYLPYSMNAYEKRRNIIKIMHETYRLQKAKFGIDSEMKIITMSKFTLPKPLPPDYFMIPIVKFAQEARPYIRLIGDYL